MKPLFHASQTISGAVAIRTQTLPRWLTHPVDFFRKHKSHEHNIELKQSTTGDIVNRLGYRQSCQCALAEIEIRNTRQLV